MAERTCSVEGCERDGKLTRGMCQKHYRYWLDHTSPEQRPTAPRFARKFDDFVDKSGDCWVWTGALTSGGYGYWSGGGERGLAHRISLSRAIGAPPVADMFACHHCDNPPCVRPDHLYWGTVQDNSRDYVTRQGVHNKGQYATHCSNGHALEGDNLRIAGRDKRRTCRTCGNERARIRQARKRAGNTLAERAAEFSASSGLNLISIQQAVQMSGRSVSTIRRAVKAGRLTLHRYSWMHCWIDTAELMEWRK